MLLQRDMTDIRAKHNKESDEMFTQQSFMCSFVSKDLCESGLCLSLRPICVHTCVCFGHAGGVDGAGGAVAGFSSSISTMR